MHTELSSIARCIRLMPTYLQYAYEMRKTFVVFMHSFHLSISSSLEAPQEICLGKKVSTNHEILSNTVAGEYDFHPWEMRENVSMRFHDYRVFIHVHTCECLFYMCVSECMCERINVYVPTIDAIVLQ